MKMEPRRNVTFAQAESPDVTSSLGGEPGCEMAPREAEEVFIYMHRNFRVSRNIRAHWLFDHVNRTVRIDPDATMDNKYCNEMSVYGIIPKGGPTDDDLSDEDFLVTVDTKITYISRYYRHVFVLDLSPSTIVADEESDCCLCTRLMKSLRTSMVSAVKGFTVPGTKRTFRPQIYISVCVFVPFLTFEHDSFLIQGVLLTESNVHKIISTVTEKFKVLFTRLYEFAHPILNRWGRLKRRYKNYKFDSVCETSIGDTDSLIEDYDFRQLNPVKNPGPEEKPPRPPNIMSYPRGTWNLYDEGQEGFPAGAVVEGYILPEWSLIFMLRIGLISTQMLPENTQSNVILITDAVCGIPDAAALQKVLTQLRSYTIACSFIQLQSHSSSEPVFGHVASCELFHFLAMATFGTYLPNCKCVSGEDYVVEEEDYEKDNDSGEDSDEYVEEPLAVRLKTVQKLEASQYEEEAYVSLNSYHRALICWCFQNALADNEHITKTIMAINPEFAQLHKQGVERHCRLATVYRSNLHQLLYVRLREGFTLKSAHVSEDGNLIHVVLCLPFRPLVFLEYSIWSPWPAERCERHDVKVELVIQAPYNELKDLLTEGQYLDPARLNLTKSVVDSIIEADRLLLHIHSFNTAVPFYTIPRGVTTEYALFSVHERTVIRQPNTCLGPHEEAKTRCFIDFWRVLLELNDSTWQKWVHTHSERVVLAVDGLPFEAFNTTRTLQLPCFRAFTVLLECIKKHSSFCLVNRSTFVTFCGTRKDGSPEYFYMTRICLEPPCVVLKTAFLGGINTSVRRRVVDEFRVRLLGLKFEVEKKDQADEDDDDSDDSDVPSESEGARGGLPVLNVIRRPMERIMVRYREVPADLRMIVRVQEETVDEDEIKLITLHNAIAKCLVCRRTVIVLTDYGVTGGAFEARPVADFILNVLVKRRLREHFKPAWTQNNIFSLCRQVFSQSSYVLEQFIMFPATTVSIPLMRRRGNAQRGRKQCTIYPMPSRESSRALALVTELWTEPDAVDATGQQAAPVTEDVYLASVLYTVDRLIRVCGGCNNPRPRLSTTGLHFNRKPHNFHARCIPENPTDSQKEENTVVTQILEQIVRWDTPDEHGAPRSCVPTKSGKSPFVTVYQHLFCVTNAMKHAPKEIYAIGPFAKDVLNTTHCTDMLLAPLTIELEMLSDVSFNVVSKKFWADTAKAVEKITDHPDEFCRPMTCRVYLRRTSPWSVGVVILPDDMSQLHDIGTLPVIVGVCAMPPLAYSIGLNHFSKKLMQGPLKVFPNEWMMKTNLPSDNLRYISVQEPVMRTFSSYFEEKILARVRLLSVFRTARKGVELSSTAMECLQEEGISIELEMESVPDALKTFCRHLHHQKGEPDADAKDCCNDESNLNDVFESVLYETFKAVPGIGGLYFCDFETQDIRTKKSLAAENAKRAQAADLVFDEEDKPLMVRPLAVEDKTKRHSISQSDGSNIDEELALDEASEADPCDLSDMVGRAPLFLQFQCTLLYPDKDATTDSFCIEFMPVCVHQLLNKSTVKPTGDYDLKKVDVCLEIVAIANIPSDDAPKKKKKKVKFAQRRRIRDSEDIESADSRAKAFYQLLPMREREALRHLIKNMNGVLELERILTASRKGDVTVEKLKMISRFISKECILNRQVGQMEEKTKSVSLVIQSDLALKRLMERLDGLSLQYATLVRCGQSNVFYCCKVDDKAAFEKIQLEEMSRKNSAMSLMQCQAQCQHDGEAHDDLPAGISASNFVGLHSEMADSPRNRFGSDARSCRSTLAVDDSFDFSELSRRDHLFDFWLILTVDKSFILQFCQRYKERHSRIPELAWRECRHTLRRINQELLLERMLETRECDSLLLATDDPFKQDNDSGNEGSQTDPPIMDEARFTFPPGYFACNVMNEMWFKVPVRLLSSSQQSALLSAYQALKPAMVQFAVRNRKNTYVLKDLNGNVVYMQIHISTETYGLLRIQDREPKKRKMQEAGHRMNSEILMTISGVEPPTPEIVGQLRDAVTKRLEHASLQVLLQLLAKNPSMRLETYDVQFLQRDAPHCSDTKFMSLPAVCQGYLASFFYYVNQHMQALMSIAKYRDEASGASSRHASVSRTMPPSIAITSASASMAPIHMTRRANTINSSSGFTFISKALSQRTAPAKIGRSPSIAASAAPVSSVSFGGFSSSLASSSNRFQPYPPLSGDLPHNYSPLFYLSLKPPKARSTEDGIAVVELRIVNKDGSVAGPLIEGRNNNSSHQTFAPYLEGQQKLAKFAELTKTVRCDCPDPDDPDVCGYLQVIVWKTGSVSIEDLQSQVQGAVASALCDIVTEFGYLNTSAIIESGAVIPSSPGAFTTVQHSKSISNKLGSPAEKRSLLRKRDSYDHHIHPPSTPQSDTSLFRKNTMFSFDNGMSLNAGKRGSNASDLDKLSIRDDFRESQRMPDFISQRTVQRLVDWFQYVVQMPGDTTSVYEDVFEMDCPLSPATPLHVVRDRIASHFGTADVLREDVFLCSYVRDHRASISIPTNSSPSVVQTTSSDLGGGKFEVVQGDPRANVLGDFGVEVPDEPSIDYVMISFIKEVAVETQRFGFDPVGHAPDMLKRLANNTSASCFAPYSEENSFIPRQRIMIGYLQGTIFTVYFYNFHPSAINFVRGAFNYTGLWHTTRARLLREIGLHKAGITHLSPLQPTPENAYQTLVWFDPAQLVSKEFPPDNLTIPEFAKLPPEYSRLLFRMYRQPHEIRTKNCRRNAVARRLPKRFQADGECLMKKNFTQMLSLREKLKNRLNCVRQVTLLHDRLSKGEKDVTEAEFFQLLGSRKERSVVEGEEGRKPHRGPRRRERPVKKIKRGVALDGVSRNAAQLVHYVHTPVLFFPSWRKKIAEIRAGSTGLMYPPLPTENIREEPVVVAQEAFATRSKKMSQARPPQPPPPSMSLLRNRSNTASTRNPSTTMSRHVSRQTTRPSTEDEGFSMVGGGMASTQAKIKTLYILVNDYAKYMETEGFKVLEVTKRSKLTDHRNWFKLTMKPGCTYSPWIVLFKASPGGLLFVTLTFSAPYFSIRLYELDRSRFATADYFLQDKMLANLNQREELGELVQQFKLSCHAHSFAYDFHLRVLSKHLVGKSTEEPLFSPHFNTIAFLGDFIEYYGCRPLNTRNCVYEERVEQPLDQSVTGDDLWTHLLHRHPELNFTGVFKLKRRDILRVVLYEKTDRVLNQPEPQIKLLFFTMFVDNSNVLPLIEDWIPTGKKRKRGRRRIMHLVGGAFRHVNESDDESLSPEDVSESTPTREVESESFDDAGSEGSMTTVLFVDDEEERSRLMSMIRLSGGKGVDPETGLTVATNLFGYQNVEVDTTNFDVPTTSSMSASSVRKRSSDSLLRGQAPPAPPFLRLRTRASRNLPPLPIPPRRPLDDDELSTSPTASTPITAIPAALYKVRFPDESTPSQASPPPPNEFPFPIPLPLEDWDLPVGPDYVSPTPREVSMPIPMPIAEHINPKDFPECSSSSASMRRRYASGKTWQELQQPPKPPAQTSFDAEEILNAEEALDTLDENEPFPFQRGAAQDSISSLRRHRKPPPPPPPPTTTTTPATTSEEAIPDESITYIQYQSSRQRSVQRELEDVTTQYRHHLKRIIADGQVQCRTDQLWNKAKEMPTPREIKPESTLARIFSAFRQKTTDPYEDVRCVQNFSLTAQEMTALLMMVRLKPLKDYADRADKVLEKMGSARLCRFLLLRFGASRCRFFDFPKVARKYMMVINDEDPNLVFFLYADGAEAPTLWAAFKEDPEAGEAMPMTEFQKQRWTKAVKELCTCVVGFVWSDLILHPFSTTNENETSNPPKFEYSPPSPQT